MEEIYAQRASKIKFASPLITMQDKADSGSSSRRHENFPLISNAGSGHANHLRFDQSRCILVRRTPINYISLGCSMPVLSVGDSW